MKELYRKPYLTSALLAVFVALSGCKAPTVDYQVVQSATIRIMNFAPNCQAPIDAYWSTNSDPHSTFGPSANVQNLRFGQASVYSTSINVAANGTTYYVRITPTRDTTKQLFASPIAMNLQPNQKYTLLITTDPNNSSNWIYQILTDAPSETADANTHAFIRFANMQQGVGPLTIRVNDPVMGDAINSTPADFNQVSAYVPIPLVADTNYAFYVLNSKNQILSRLTGQTFAPGTFWTVVYSGDSCDIVVHPEDAQRLRIYDDNGTGNDQTSTIPSFRYNIVNAINPVYGANIQYVGFLVNSEGLPQFQNLSIPPIPVGGAGGAGWKVLSSDSTFWQASYQTASIPVGTGGLPVSAFITDRNGGNQSPLFTNVNVSLPLTDTNRAVSIVFYDTIAPNTLGAGKSFAFTMPDTADANSAIFVFVPAVFGKGITTAKSATLFYYQTPDGKVTGSKYNSPSGAITGNSRIWTTKVGGLSASGTTINIVDSVFGGGSNRTPIKGATFTAIPGGIYEIVSHGDPNVPATLATTVVLVNSNKP